MALSISVPIRITSYNVCYTKLLRIPLVQNKDYISVCVIMPVIHEYIVFLYDEVQISADESIV